MANVEKLAIFLKDCGVQSM